MPHVSVTVDDAHLGDIRSVAETLSRHGLRVEQVLDGLGIITGSVGEGQRQALTAVDGVASVDEELDVQLPPPDSPMQ